MAENPHKCSIYSCLSVHCAEHQVSAQVEGRGFKRKHKTFPWNSRAICPDAKLSGLRLKTYTCEIVSQLPWRWDQTAGRREEIGLVAFRCGAKQKDGQWMEPCCYRRELTEGVSALCCSPALIWFQMPGCEAREQSHFLMPQCCYGNSRTCQTWCSGLCVHVSVHVSQHVESLIMFLLIIKKR